MNPVKPRHLRIFMASPGDVTHERELALTVLDQLPYEPSFRGHVTIEPVAWDKKGAGAPILANMTPQDSIKLGLPTPAECDIVVIIFWSRMGTPLPAQYAKADGSRYLSGTEWECENAIQASEKSNSPAVLLYRRTAAVPVDLDDPELEEKKKQRELVNRFFDSLVDVDGSIQRGYNHYEGPSDFKEALELHLKAIIERLIRTPTPHQPPSPQTFPLPWPTSPFPGLRAFKSEDAPIFFGRERETDALVKRVEKNRVVAVVGASGSGKSSLVGAGLIPRLLLTSGNEGWLPTTTTPDYLGSGNPFAALAAALLRDLGSIEQPQLSTALSQNSNLLSEISRRVLAHRSSSTKILLFIDQFEELFTTVAPSYRQPYVDMLVRTASSEEIRIVLTLRGDFYGKCVEIPQLAKLLEESTYPLSVPGIAALYEMITRPASRADLQFEESLAQRVLDETGDEPGSLALMAYTLDELYRLSSQNEKLLTHSAYEELGGVQGAIGKRSESVFVGLREKERAALPQVFRELVDVDERATATRQRASLSRAAKTKEAASLIKALTDARLLVQSRNERNEPFVEVAHEALLRSWDRLADWIRDTQGDLRLLRRVRIAAREWDENGRRDDFLWSHERLQPVYAMRDRFGVEFDSVVLDFIRPEVERLLDVFKSHHQYFRHRPIIERFIELGAVSIPCALQALPYAVSKSARRDIQALLSRYPDKTVTTLIENLSHQEGALRLASVSLLASKFPHLAIEALTRLMKDEKPLIRRYAAAGLGGSQAPATIEILKQSFRDDDLTVREISAIELASFGTHEVILPLIAGLENHNDAEIRPLCAHLLGLLGNLSPMPWYSSYARIGRRMLTSSKETNGLYILVGTAIKRADGALANNLPRQVVDTLILNLHDKNEKLRDRCTAALGKIGDSRAIPHLLKLFAGLESQPNSHQQQFRQLLIHTLGEFKDNAALPALKRARTDADVHIRLASEHALEKIGTSEATKVLQNLA